MLTEFKLPPLGENIAAGDVVKVLIAKGQAVQKNQIVLEIETDKAVVEVPSSLSGKVGNVLVEVGKKIKIGDVIFQLEGHTQAAVAEPVAAVPAAKSKPAPKIQTVKSEAVKTEPVITSAAVTPAASPNTATAQTPQMPQPASSTDSRTFVLPTLGENIAKGELVKILVKAGDIVKPLQNVVEVETDKAVIEVPLPDGGTITEILAQVGQKLSIGEPIFFYTTQVAAADVSKPIASAAPVAAPISATPQQATTVLTQTTATATTPQPIFTVPNLPTGPVLAAPSVRKLAREIGVDIQDVKANDAAGRITIEDVKAHAKKMSTEYKTERLKPVGGALPQIELPDFSRWGNFESKPMSNIRKATALRMTQAWSTIPQVTQTDEADVTLLEELRQRFGKRAEDLGTKLTSTAILLKIVGSALKVFPQFNASIDMGKEEIIYKKYIHIGVAVDTDRGLLVPVVRDVNKKNIIDLSKELGLLSEKARLRKTTLEEMQGASFTISNLGGIGGGHFTPIVNPPEVAILGVGKWKYQPVYIDGEFKPRKILPLSLTYDHRLIDGADAARFLRWLCEAVQDPFLMELEG